MLDNLSVLVTGILMVLLVHRVVTAKATSKRQKRGDRT